MSAARLGAGFDSFLDRISSLQDERMLATVNVRDASNDEKLAVIRKLIGRLLDQGRRDERIRELTIGIIRDSGVNWSVGDKPYYSTAKAIHRWFTERAVYIHDPAGVERFATARKTLFKTAGASVPGGDCDDLSIALGSMMASVGFTSAVVLVDTDGSGVLTHAIPAIKTALPKTYRIRNPQPEKPGPAFVTWVANKQWLPLETTKGPSRADGKYGLGWWPVKTRTRVYITGDDAF